MRHPIPAPAEAAIAQKSPNPAPAFSGRKNCPAPAAHDLGLIPARSRSDPGATRRQSQRNLT
ncbi:hypothetical protein CBM2587_A80011 [Cupriavidus taiwanensis]|uniref:Uncharacterized protein n=1 Tax=Cupriavidus taiwanensis TaxID=164546 RepID=A0A375BWD4_9BURK|nr:hypothetical protein CBM2587_A80011 [Cupriavidus taiwanensis]